MEKKAYIVFLHILIISMEHYNKTKALTRVFPKTIVLTTKSHFDVKKMYASILGSVVRTIALGKTRISAIRAKERINRVLQFFDGKTTTLPRIGACAGLNEFFPFGF